MKTHPETTDRRTFLRRCGRVALLGAGAAVMARFVRRGQVKLVGQACVNEGMCSRCATYPGCGLPQALSRRRTLREDT